MLRPRFNVLTSFQRPYIVVLIPCAGWGVTCKFQFYSDCRVYKIEFKHSFCVVLCFITLFYYYFLVGTTEIFTSPCENEIQSFFHNKGYFSGYIEGWALYAENPVLSDDVMLYENNMLQKLGMYKWQVCLQGNINSSSELVRLNFEAQNTNYREDYTVKSFN